jgi:hypothetical protein
MTEETQEIESSTTETAEFAVEAPASSAPAPVEKPLSIREALGKAAKDGAPPAKEQAPAAKPQAKPAAPAKPAGGPVRDASGRFTSEAPAGGAAKPQGETIAAATQTPVEGEAAKPEAVAVEVRTPQAWKPHVRELAAKLPAEFRPILEEAGRRERETAIALDQAAQGRKFGDSIRAAISPFEAVFRANNVDPVNGVAQLAQTAFLLNTAAPQVKASIIANMVRTFLGTDEASIGLLAQHIDGAPGQAGPTQAQQLNPRAIVQQAKQEMLQELQSQRQAHWQEEAQVTAAEFEKTHDLLQYPGVRAATADLLALAAQQRRKMDPEQAYALAVSMDPEASVVAKQREASKAASNAQASTARTAAAASSVRSQPTGPAVHSGKTMSPMEALRQAAADVSGRGRV